ncbi:hypothetical protein TNCV_4825861 [Trichonephila clavipes]|uniref:Uncharacterized protein n=1 Tax=Trichonephila clavipes TaxID=2585209 RepID=A0A8X6RQ78_TRICX|nr:hypothetical protein TNCV_4825861 [Trichonephila clavipes]
MKHILSTLHTKDSNNLAWKRARMQDRRSFVGFNESVFITGLSHVIILELLSRPSRQERWKSDDNEITAAWTLKSGRQR